MRDETINNFTFDTTDLSVYEGYGISQWGESGTYNGADLMRLLNPGYESDNIGGSLYWNRKKGNCYYGIGNQNIPCDFTKSGLIDASKELIDTVKWYTSASSFGINSNNYYIETRRATTIDFSSEDDVVRTENWIGKIGLIYPEDYGYASKKCYLDTILTNYSNEDCINSNWMFETYIWTMVAKNDSGKVVFYVNDDGKLYGNFAYWADKVYPTLYLKPNVRIINGDGTLENPYKLTL